MARLARKWVAPARWLRCRSAHAAPRQQQVALARWLRFLRTQISNCPSARAAGAGTHSKRSRACLSLLLLGLSVQGAAVAYEPSINYALQCSGCHTPDGSGVEGRVPSVRETLLPFARMAEGRRFLVQVPGAAQSSLTNQELADLLNWMLQSLSNEPPTSADRRFTEAEVAAYRKQTLVAVRATRERLLAATAP